MAGRLSNGTLRRISGGVAVPGYDRSRVGEGIVHLGVGAFHRAHQAVYVDDCLGAGAKEWGIVGASLRSADTRDALAPQDGLYALAEQGPQGEALRVVGALKSLLVAPEDPAGLVARMADPAVRIVTLTVTEKAYMRGPDGDLDADRPDLAWDRANPALPRTVHGFLAGALAARRRAGVPPFTVLCCDNLPSNGETVRRLLLQHASMLDKDLHDHIEVEVAFPSTMVDRIVPATTDADRARISAALGLEDAWPVKAEPFMQWVVEERFTQGRPDWEPFGVSMVADVRPFEDMKLRLLNGAHSTLAYLGLLKGRLSVCEAFRDPALRGVVERLWAEASDTLPRGKGLDPAAYVAALAERFSNPALVHRTAQIANDGSQKLPQRIVAVFREREERGQASPHLSLAVAGWIACCESRPERGAENGFTDPLDPALSAIFARREGAQATVAAVFAAAGFSGPALASAVSEHLDRIRKQGVDAAIAHAAGIADVA